MSDLILPDTFFSNSIDDKDEVVNQLKQFFKMSKDNQVTFLNAILKQETSVFLLSEERGIGFSMKDNDNDEKWLQFNPFIVENGERFQLNINLDNTKAILTMEHSGVSIDEIDKVKLNSFTINKETNNEQD